MRFDRDWLLEHVDPAPAADEAADRLTAVGFMVELREELLGSEVWDVEVTTNRPDAMNHRGLARELAVATGARLAPVQSRRLEEAGEAASDLAAVRIDVPAVCRRFAARIVRGVRLGPSPDWLRERLERCGIRSINQVVDVTNYVLLELGQPLHAYDLARVAGGLLIARTAEAGETLTTLDGETRRLTTGMPVIADRDRVVGLAGVMGGSDTEVGQVTADILLEGACFDPLAVRRTARALGMHTEASHRFERGSDPEMPPVAVDLAAAMIADLAGGTVAPGRIDVVARPFEPSSIELGVAGLSAFAGFEVAADEVERILAGLGFDPERRGDRIRCAAPSWRVDVERTADLYEEAIRHLGYDSVPTELPTLSTRPGRRHGSWELVDRARVAAVRTGLAEIMTFAFISAEDDALADELPLATGGAVSLANPLAATQATMRRSLYPGLLGAVRDTLNAGERDVALFEQGRVFASDGDEPRETERIAIAISGRPPAGTASFALLRGIVDDLLALVGITGPRWEPGDCRWLADGENAVILGEGGLPIAYAGRVSEGAVARWDLRQPAWVAEIDLTAAPESPPNPRFEPLPRHPAVTADMTVEHTHELAYAHLVDVVRWHASHRVASVDLLDRFTGGDLPADRVRTTLRLVYRHPERSLTQDEVNAEQETLRAALGEELGVRFA